MEKRREKFSINNEKGFKAFFQEYFPALCSFAYNFIKNSETNQDIVQDVFVKLWERRSGFDDLMSTKVFLYKTTRNDCLSFLKHKKVEARYIGECAHHSINEKIVLNKIIEEETYRLMHEVIESLPLKCREIIELHLKGVTNNEIADILHISVNTVKTQKKIAYKIFREKVKYFVFLFQL